MLKGCPKPANRRPIVTRDYPQRNGFDDIDELQPNIRHFINDELVEQQRDTVLDVMLRDTRSGEQSDNAFHAYSPNHVRKRTKFRPRPTVCITPPKNLTFQAAFCKVWRHRKVIGEGGDGTVHLYQQPDGQGTYVAVKVPRCYSAREDVEQEIVNMRLIGKHEHILELYCASDNWYPYGPAMFIPYCEMGSLIDYRESWCAQQAWDGQPERVSEITMWKLFRDMALALNYLHRELGVRYVHNDFKPANILAVVPSDETKYQTLPEEPTFKLSDFARLAPWPTPKDKPHQCFDGTPEYAPPRHEQRAPVLPSADIWGLGATLQYMAFGINPIQSKEAFIRDRKAKGKSHPELKNKSDWASEYWRIRIPTVYRPIDVPLKVLQRDYDLVRGLPDYQQYGARLGYWYAQLWKPVGTRPKASQLVADAIPRMDDMVERLKLQRLQQMGQYE